MVPEVKNVNGYVAPALTADGVLLRGRDVLLIRRGNDPFKDAWALPGGFVEVGEVVERAAEREVEEETGLDGIILELLGVYSDPSRDPRGHTVSVVYVMRADGTEAAGDDAADAKWWPIDAPPRELAFDHDRILADARRWLDEPANAARVAAADSGDARG